MKVKTFKRFKSKNKVHTTIYIIQVTPTHNKETADYILNSVMDIENDTPLQVQLIRSIGNFRNIEIVAHIETPEHQGIKEIRNAILGHD